MIKYKFIAYAYDLEIKDTLNKGIKVFENIRISNNPNKVTQMFHPQFKSAIGSLEYDYLLSGSYYYAEGEINDDTIFEDELGLEFLDEFMKKTQLVNNLLWLVKDNSVHIESGYMQLENGINTKFHSNGRSMMFNNMTGFRESLIFDKKELKIPELFYKRYFYQAVDTLGKNFNEALIDTSVLEFQVYEASRIERAFYLLQTARSQRYLPERVSIFISLLETLFSTSNTDVTHKLRERIAWLIGESYEEREEIFNDMGVIYGIRSHHVHNSTVPKNARTTKKLILYTEKLENYTRRAIVKVLTEKEIYFLYQKNEKGKYDDDNLEKFFKSLCLGKDINKDRASN
ncbi:HEPN domain-containing protein [Bacillus safensis]|uniref:HEPN domain-containing protein n=1 Tax=Bacillus safensis TaxID=561879 RepID=UPI00227FB9FA|nr:HEPN domain-containing protein [Bacillus safensis]MCY7733969.1 HEPN domain-containing protein [Bacillus safensis]MEC1113440.1 HEPN domain-containing protein [Bacillus safensis]